MPVLLSVQIQKSAEVLRNLTVIPVDDSWTLCHVFLAGRSDAPWKRFVHAGSSLSWPTFYVQGENLEEGRFSENLLPLAVGDVLELRKYFWKYFRFILQGNGNGSGASFTRASLPTPDTFTIMCHTAAEVHYNFICFGICFAKTSLYLGIKTKYNSLAYFSFLSGPVTRYYIYMAWLNFFLFCSLCCMLFKS